MSHKSIFEKLKTDDPLEFARLIASELDKTVYTQDPIDIIGKGQGLAKTTTETYGSTVTENFGVLDELFAHWQVPKTKYEYSQPVLHLDFAPVTAEVGKTFSIELAISSQGDGTLINDSVQYFNIEDIEVPSTAFESFSVNFTIPKTITIDGFHDLHIKIKRIASSNELLGDIALHHASMEYEKYQRNHDD